MQCLRCHNENREGRRFCAACGALLARACTACGFSNEPEARFCGGCGAPLTGVVPARSAFDPPQQYTPPHLAERILSDRSALEGERKQVTVLFADLKGSLELLAHRDPEESRGLLDPILELMMAAVHQYEGTVNQVLGDGIMALFGAPVAHEDHAVRAGYAALKMQRAIGAYAQGVEHLRDADLRIRVGLNSGEVVVRGIGNDLTMDYSAVGQTTHLASRMEQLAMPGTILATEPFARLTEGYLHFKPLGLMAIRGLAEPVDVLQLVDAEPTRTRFQAASGRGLTRFVGRQGEMDTLRHALERTRSGHGQAVAVIGEPGTGKSRLFYEFLDSELTRDWLKLETGALSYSRGTAFLPIRDLLKAYFQIEEQVDPRKIEEKLGQRIQVLGEGVRRILPALRSLLDAPVEDQEWGRLEPSQRRERILDGVKRLLIGHSQVQPLIVAFENLHWIDAQTQAFLDNLVESLPTAHILLMVNYRPEYQHTWSNKTYYTQLRLDPLPPESAEELLRVLLGDDPALQALKRLLIDRTEGNPFFLEESVRQLVELTILSGEWGRRRLVKSPGPIQVPPTVQAILGARIDRLPPEEKRLLQSAAVIGRRVPLPLLHAVAGLPDAELRHGLAHLQAAEFLYETSLFPELEYAFKHALTQEVAYGSLVRERRRALHARIVEAMETLQANRPGNEVEGLAHHALQGAVWEKAAAYYRQAGTKAAMRSAYREAVECFEQALEALHQVPESRTTVEQSIDLRLSLRTALRPLGELHRVIQYLREAEGLAQRLQDPRRQGWVTVWMSQYLWVTGHSTEARTYGHKAKAIAETLQEVPLTVVANLFLGLACLTSGDFQLADDCFLNMMHLLDVDLGRERFGTTGFPAVQSRAWLAWSLAERGAFDQGIGHGQQGVRIAEAVDDPYSLIIAYLGLGMLYDIKGELGQAAPLLERGLALARDWKVTLLAPRVAGMLGYTYALSGHVAEGLALLDEALKVIESMEQGAFQALIMVRRGEASAVGDRQEDALAFGKRALVAARERGQRGYEAWALRLLGEIASQSGPREAEQAERYYREAWASANELGMRPLVSHCHLGLGKLYRRTGKRQEAQEHLTIATTMYREMDMRFWLEQTEAEIGLLG